MISSRDGSSLAEVYVIGMPNGPQKIGISNNTKSRIDFLQTGSPNTLSVAFTLTTSRLEAAAVEMHAHWLLRAVRTRGEWFECTPEEAIAAVEKALQSVRAGTTTQERLGGKHSPRARPDPQRTSAGADLASILRSIGWSRVHLAERMGCNEKVIRQMESGKQSIPGALMEWLAEWAEFEASHSKPVDWRRNSAYGE